MKKNRHTPGRWRFSHREDPDTGKYYTQVYSTSGESIATFHWYPKPINGGVGTYRSANARLCAAAPDLLNASRRALRLLNGTKDKAHRNVWDALMRAILKAETATEEARQ